MNWGKRAFSDKLLERLGRLVSDCPRISEIYLNPVKGMDVDLYTVDGRIIVQE
jgi:hypothetical protein